MRRFLVCQESTKLNLVSEVDPRAFWASDKVCSTFKQYILHGITEYAMKLISRAADSTCIGECTLRARVARAQPNKRTPLAQQSTHKLRKSRESEQSCHLCGLISLQHCFRKRRGLRWLLLLGRRPCPCPCMSITLGTCTTMATARCAGAV